MFTLLDEIQLINAFYIEIMFLFLCLHF